MQDRHCFLLLIEYYLAMHTYYEAIKDHHWTELGDEVIVLHAFRCEYYSFSNVASLIWKQLQNKMSVAELEKLVCAEYSVSNEECSADLGVFLEFLKSSNFIREANAV